MHSYIVMPEAARYRLKQRSAAVTCDDRARVLDVPRRDPMKQQPPKQPYMVHKPPPRIRWHMEGNGSPQ